MKVEKKALAFFMCLVFPFYGFSQSQLKKKSLYGGAVVGLSFYQNGLARANQQIYFGQDIDNSVQFAITPKINYAIANRFFLSGQIGVGYEYFENRGNGLNFRAINYKIGPAIKYYFLKIAKSLYLDAEVGLNYNYFSMGKDSSKGGKAQSLVKTYLDFGINIFISDKLLFSVVLKDFVDYHSTLPNFDRRKGWVLNSVFKNFIHFPHFSIAYKIN